MSETEPNLSRAERELEAALAGLTPAPAGIELSALAYAAGRRSARRRLMVWRAAAAVLAVALFTAALVRPEPRVVERIVMIESPATLEPGEIMDAPPRRTAPPTALPARPAYLVLRHAVLERGLDALPQRSSASPAGPQPAVLRAGDIYGIGDQL